MTISVVLCVIYIGRKFPILRLRRTDWVYNPAFMCEHLYVAVPMALQFSVIALGLIIIQTVCNSFGSDTIAAFTSALRIEQLATSPLVALGFALATYTAQNFGAGKIGRIRRGVVRSSLVSVLFSVSVALLVRFVGEDMIGVFIKGEKPEIIDIAKGIWTFRLCSMSFWGRFLFSAIRCREWGNRLFRWRPVSLNWLCVPLPRFIWPHGWDMKESILPVRLPGLGLRRWFLSAI